MSGILFPDLAAAFGAAEATSASKAQRDYINEDRETGKYFGAALKGDPDAQARVMTNPRYASALSSQLERIEVGKRARVKEDADYITTSGMAILNAPADQQPGLYARVRQEAAAKGRDVSTWPTTYDPGWVKFNVDKAMPVSEYYKRNGEGVQYVEPGGGGGAAPGGGGVNPNNIGNVRPPGASSGFQQPATLDDGIRLAVNNVKAYPAKFNGGQPMSLMQIGARWAPVGDGANDPAQWARNVGSIGGLNPNQPLDFNDPATAAAFARGLHGAEHGASKVLPLERYAQVLTGGGQRGMPVGREVDIATNAAPMPEPPPGMAVFGTPAQMPGGPSGAPPGMAVGDTQPRADASGNALPPPQGQEIPREATKGVQLPPGYKIGTQGGKIFSPVPGYIQVMPPGGGAPILWPVPKASEAAPAGYRYAPDGRTLQVIPGGPADKPQGSGPFTGKSPEAEGLNMLVANKTLTLQQAAEMAAGKTVTDPETGRIMFLTPSGVFSQQAGQPPQPVGGTPAGQPPQAGAAPAGMIPLTGGKPVQMTEGQSNAALYADRMREAEAVISANEKAGMSVGGKALEMLPGGAGNFLQSDNYQLFEQARRNFINAVLRRESGAVIADTEFANAEKQYFPRPGDSEAVLKQKAANRRSALDGVSRAAGPSYKPTAEPGATQPPAQGAPKPPADNAERGRLIFDAQKAIKEGRDPVAVRARLKELNIDPAELDAK